MYIIWNYQVEVIVSVPLMKRAELAIRQLDADVAAKLQKCAEDHPEVSIC